MTEYMHGGDIYRNKVNTDHSVSINPLDWPGKLRQEITDIMADPENVCTYPDLIYAGLREAAAKYTGEPEGRIVFGNGASELISGIMNLYRPKKVLLFSPCYSGYERAAIRPGTDIIRVNPDEKDGYGYSSQTADSVREFIEESFIDEGDAVIIGNPSNPAGRLIPVDVYGKIVKACEERGIILISDECFAELSMSSSEYLSYYGSIRGRTLIRLRALTKSFRLAGLRLGYAICEDDETARKLSGILPEWNVSTPAMKVGRACFEYECGLAEDKRYMTASYEFIKDERERISDALKELGIRVYDSEANFLLIYSKKDLYEELLKRGLLIRDCSNIEGLRKGYYRISLRDSGDNERLIENIRDCL